MATLALRRGRAGCVSAASLSVLSARVRAGSWASAVFAARSNSSASSSQLAWRSPRSSAKALSKNRSHASGRSAFLSRLQVAVEDSVRVRHLEAARDLRHQRRHRERAHRATVQQCPLERLPLEALHDEEGEIAVAPVIRDPDHVPRLPGQPSCDLRLEAEARGGGRGVLDSGQLARRGEELDRHFFVERLVRGEPHSANRPAPEESLELVAPRDQASHPLERRCRSASEHSMGCTKCAKWPRARHNGALRARMPAARGPRIEKIPATTCSAAMRQGLIETFSYGLASPESTGRRGAIMARRSGEGPKPWVPSIAGDAAFVKTRTP
jgi:hypothetical protein